MSSVDKYGIQFGEKWHLFLKRSSEKLPFDIENIGYSFPNNEYSLTREDSPLFVVEYVISGHQYLEIGDKKYELKEGDICIIWPYTKHHYYSDQKNPVEKKWANFTSDIFGTVLEEFGLKNINVIHNPSAQKYFDQLMIVSDKSNYSEEICYDVASILFELLCHIKKSMDNDANIYPSKIARTVKDYLDGSIFKRTTLDDIVRLTFYSKKQITREFKKYYHDTPYNYLINLKIGTAEKLLTMTNLSIKEIADRLCFDNQHYFSKAFKNKTGTSPIIYKKNNS
ncbi:MAG: AraC family transcriptional regulator [Bacilli bacterium]|nr:AraC family transcriptional regulator [Bacilli bacterium]